MKLKNYRQITAFEAINAVEELVKPQTHDDKSAIKLYRGWLQYHPNDPLAYVIAFNLGTLLKDNGDDVAAEKSYRFAIKLNPGCIEAQFNLGAQLQRLNRSDEAVAQWQMLLNSGLLSLPRDQNIYEMTLSSLRQLQPEYTASVIADVATGSDPYQVYYAQPAMSVITAVAALGSVKGVEIYKGWLQRHPVDPLAYALSFNLGALLKDTGEDAAAETAYRRAIELNPDCIEAQFNLGSQLERLNRPEEAVAQWKSLLDSGRLLLPRDKAIYIMTLNNLGRLLEMMRDYRASEDYLTRSLLADGTQTDVLHHWVFIRQKQCEWPVFKEIPGVTPESMLDSAGALAIIAATDDNELQLKRMRRYAKEKIPEPPYTLSDGKRYNHQRMRVGYLSSDFCMHAVSLLTVELFELHNRADVEVYGFCWSKNDGTAFHQRVITAFDHYIQIGALTDEAAAQLIYSNEIDILVDLHGLTQGARPSILAYRPAPIQVTYLGLPATTGLPSIDYVIADRFLIPEEEAPNYSEKPLYMPDVYQISDRKRLVGLKPTRESCGLPENAFVFCSLNNNYKYTPEVFDVWMNILRRTSNSVLWLLSDNPNSEANLRREAEARGIESERLIFTQRVLPEDYLARYQAADLFLDTFPFNAGTTANDALWMSLPILTYSGRSFASRMAGALLTAAKLEELITFNLRDYEEKAVFLANNPHECVRMHEHLKAVHDSGALFDAPRFVRNLEVLYRKALDELPVTQKNDYIEVPYRSSYLDKLPDPSRRRYVVVAPPYQHNSAGIRVLYDLQKWLVLAGLDAIVCTWFDGYPVDQFAEDIVIYPEVAPGNLLKAKRVIRYILNEPGKLGYGEKTYAANEVLVAYNQTLAHYANGVMLQVPSIEPFFHTLGAVKTKNAVFVGKGKNLNAHPADCVVITKTFPATRREMAVLLRSVKTLYMYDDFSMIGHEAKLCGCEVKLIQKDGLDVDYPDIYYPTLDEFKVQLHDFIEMTKRL